MTMNSSLILLGIVAVLMLGMACSAEAHGTEDRQRQREEGLSVTLVAAPLNARVFNGFSRLVPDPDRSLDSGQSLE